MREVALGGHPRDIQLRHLRTNLLQPGPRNAHLTILRLELCTQLEHLLVGLSDILSQGGQPRHVRVELLCRRCHRSDERRPRRPGPRVIGRATFKPAGELLAGELEPQRARLQRRRSLDQHGVRRFRLRQLVAQPINRLTRIEHAAL